MFVGDLFNNRIRLVLLNPAVSFSSNPLAFGNRPISATATLPVTLTNNGDAPLTISNISISAGTFTIAANPCPATLAVGANCVLSQVNVGRDTVIEPNSVLEGAEVGERCRIGPFARLRPGTRLHAGVHVGNYVEIKNSELQAGSKANHLSYLGDAEIGEATNIGAGTITCNYDGADKHRTTIGARAFIGSGTMLVAPVSIGADATIGAGSTITEPAPAGKLTLARARQQTIDNWQRPVKRK